MKREQHLAKILGCIFLLAWLLQSFTGYACECQFSRQRNWSPELVQPSLDQSAHVFVGQVLPRDNGTFQVAVLDVFKGASLPDTLIAEAAQADGCNKLISTGLWIFYLPRLNNKRIPVLDACNMSSRLTKPDLAVTLPASSRTLDSAAIRLFIERQQSRQQAIFTQNWLDEYALLCAYRRRHNATVSSLNFTIPAAVSLALTISTAFLLLFLWRRKRVSAS